VRAQKLELRVGHLLGKQMIVTGSTTGDDRLVRVAAVERRR
jgi:hypothetical protein